MTMKVPQRVIDDLASKGIVPGAVVKCCIVTKDERIVPNSDRWVSNGIHDSCISFSGGCNDPESWYVNSDLILKSGNSYATVITPAPSEEGLRDMDGTVCGPSMRIGIIEIANELGLPLKSGCDGNRQWGAGMYFSEGFINSYEDAWTRSSKLRLLSPEEFIRRMRVTAKPPKPIKIGDYNVKFNNGSITVGCTNVTNALVREIAGKLKEC